MSVKDILADEKKLTEVAKVAFDGVDTDGNGFVDEKELFNLMKNMATELGIPEPTEKDVKDAFKAMDADKNGKVTLDEFKVLVRQILELMA